MNQTSKQNEKQHNIKIVGITDGDPFDKSTWSGSSFAFFSELKKFGCLKAGISGLPSQFINCLFQIRNFSSSPKSWKFKYHIDIAYYKAFTKKVKKELSKLDKDYTHTLQIYSNYDVPSLIEEIFVSLILMIYSNE